MEESAEQLIEVPTLKTPLIPIKIDKNIIKQNRLNFKLCFFFEHSHN